MLKILLVIIGLAVIFCLSVAVVCLLSISRESQLPDIEDVEDKLLYLILQKYGALGAYLDNIELVKHVDRIALVSEMHELMYKPAIPLCTIEHRLQMEFFRAPGEPCKGPYLKMFEKYYDQ